MSAGRWIHSPFARVCGCAAAFLASAVVCASILSGAVGEGRVIDHVWSGNPVSYSLVVHEGAAFVAYYDAERRLTVASGQPDAGAWTYARPRGVWLPERKRMSNVTGWDSHNYLALAFDRDGFLHLSGNMHDDPLLYWRTDKPADVTSFLRLDRMTGEREERATYPVFFHSADGGLLFRYRDGSSGRGSDLYNSYDPETRTWTRLLDVPLLDGEGKRNAYAIPPTPGPDGRFHLVWMWRDSPDCATNNNLSYARSADLVRWENSRGESLELPITLSRGEIIDAAQPGEGLINTTFNLGFDADNRPVVVYHRYDGDGRSQLYVARPDTEGWTPHPVTDWNWLWQFEGVGSIVVEVKVGAPALAEDGAVLISYTTMQGGNGRLRLGAETLAPEAVLPALPAPLPPEWMRPRSSHPDMQVKLKTASDGDSTYVLRWEHLPSNRDQPRDELPPPTELRLFKLEKAQGEFLEQIGS